MKKEYIHYKSGELIKENSDHIKIVGHFGEWYVVDTEIHKGRELFELCF
ncbi:MAG: hypothetical protein LBI03_01365 [Clostridiales bacterium]|jgi:hypothetical protein|nr:hypothetical protein [Clostridiales bacterium]